MELRKTFLGDCDGVAAIEFALIAPILLLVVVAVIDFGMYLNTVMKLENTARAAAEYVAQGGDPADIQTDIVDPSPLTDDQKQSLVVETDFACECKDGEVVDCQTGTCTSIEDDYRRRFMEVTLSGDYEPLLNWPFLPNSLNLSGYVRYQVN